MSTEKIRCGRCRGQKEYAGMGGIMKECEVCDGTGKVAIVDMSVNDIDKGEEIVSVEHSEEELDMVESVTDSDIGDVKVSDVTVTLVTEAQASEQIDNQPKQTLPLKQPELDELMQAVLAEPGMKPEDWARKYAHVDRLFGMTITGHHGELVTKVQRAEMRATYASQQPKADRQVDLKVAQDMASKTDPDYAVYQAEEKKLAEASKKKAAK